LFACLPELTPPALQVVAEWEADATQPVSFYATEYLQGGGSFRWLDNLVCFLNEENDDTAVGGLPFD
jgi:hypothetical protein